MRVLPRVSGGRYGLSSKEFTPGMVAGVFEELASERPRRHFTVGITDDVSGTSLTYDASLDIDPPNTVRAVFFGLGADGTVGANKNTIKILGSEEHLHAQGYFVYDSKKSGAQTVSHLRFGPQPIRAPYLVQHASFVGCHQFGLLEQVERARPGCRHPGRCCCSTAGTRRTRSGRRCRGPSRSRSWPLVPAHAPELIRTVTAEMMAGRGDDLPVSALPALRRGLHRMWAVRRGLPGRGPGRPGPQGDRSRPARAAAHRRA